MERNRVVDQLRVLGLALVILAHSAPPPWLFQLRNFDVILMVITSGMSYGLSGGELRSYTSYVVARFVRLILPVWLFLTALFSVAHFIPQATRLFPSDLILSSYLMTGGIGYVWIMRVFFFVSVLAPMMALLSRWIRDDVRYYPLVILALLASATVWHLAVPGPQANHSIPNIIAQAVIYALVFALGYRLRFTLAGKTGPVSALLFAVVIIGGLALYAESIGINLQGGKFPPSYVFLAYGVCMSIALYALLSSVDAHREVTRWDAFISLIGRSTVWIYLWHIPIVLAQRAMHLFPNFFWTWVVAMVVATLLALVQRKIVLWLVSTGALGRRPGDLARQLLVG